MSTIRDAGISGDFVHEPLSNPQAEIRLIQIDLSTGDKDSEIHCSVSTHSLANPPPYIAISYTWGNSSDKREITVNNERLNIGHNSWLALWQARLHRVQQPLRVWIDVLSIDQANDVEKGVQVSLMGTIYDNAKYVLASVGAHENDSEFLSKQVQATVDYIQDRRSPENYPEETPMHGNAFPEIINSFSLEEFSPMKMKYCSRCYRHLWFLWYEYHVLSLKICRSCDLLDRDKDDAGNHRVLTDSWGPIDKPPGRRWGGDQRCRFTCWRILEMSDGSQQRLANAFSAFSFRQYFTRLWVRTSCAAARAFGPIQTDHEKVIQETKFIRHVLVVCGDSMFTLDALWNFAWDLSENPSYTQKRGAVGYSRHLRGLLDYDGISRRKSRSLWDLTVDHHDYHCVDTRDRVFGLLSLSSDSAIRPDYTKSSLEVLLQLLEQEACNPKQHHVSSVRGPMTDISSIISGFHLGSLATEIADLLQMRRSAHAAPNLSSRKLVFDLRSPHRFRLQSKLYCRVWEDEAGNMVTSLLKDVPPSTESCEHDLEHVAQYANGAAVRVRNPLGRVVALADKKVKAGDMFLFLGDNGHPCGFDYPSAGLILRPLDCNICTIVGQFVFEGGVDVDRSYRARFRVHDAGSNTTDPLGLDVGSRNTWWLFMSPVDLLLFTASDMKCEVSSPSEGGGPVVHRTFCPEETAKRLSTNVTTDLNSSFAMCTQDCLADGPPGGDIPIIMRFDSTGLPSYEKMCEGTLRRLWQESRVRLGLERVRQRRL